MDKQQFLHRLRRAGEWTRKLALQYVEESLPECLVFSLTRYDDPQGRRGPEGTIKFFGGRFIRPEELRQMDASQAASFLWVDGRVPAWVNLHVCWCDEATTEVEVNFSKTLVAADEDRLPRDIGASLENELAPFRLRGPSLPFDWESVEKSGRISLRKNT